MEGRNFEESRETLASLQSDNENHPDIADRASSETDRSIELRSRDRQRKLISKIDAALARLDEGVYGYCEETGEPISLKRLDARPIATCHRGAGASRASRKTLSRRLIALRENRKKRTTEKPPRSNPSAAALLLMVWPSKQTRHLGLKGFQWVLGFL